LTPTEPPRADGPGPSPASAPRQILIIRFRRIGDVILTTPAIALLKKHLPDARLTYLVEEPFRRLVEGNPHLDRVLVSPSKQKRGEFVRFLRQIRREKFDVLLDMHGGPRASWTTLASRARLKVGHGIRPKRFLYDLTVPRKAAAGPLHSVESHAGFVRALGLEFPKSDIPPLFIPAARPEEAERVEEIVSLAGRPGLAVLHIGAGNEFRDWGRDHIAALIDKLTAKAGVRVALIGGAGDQKREEEILAGWGDSSKTKESVIPLTGKLSLIEIRELVARAALFIGPDSGPMHIAASTSTPIVAYFGPTLPAHFAPWRPGLDPCRTVILEREMDCRPCPQRKCATADFRCLRTITPDEVASACSRFLG
jgi:heptosyltransferase-1